LTDEPKKFELKVYSNRTVLELRQQIAQTIKAAYDTIKLLKVTTLLLGKEITESENGKTLGELNFF